MSSDSSDSSKSSESSEFSESSESIESSKSSKSSKSSASVGQFLSYWIIVKNFFQYFSEKINVERKKNLWVESIARKVARPLRFLPEAGLGGRILQ